MLDSIYHMMFKLFCYHIFVKVLNFKVLPNICDIVMAFIS